MMKFIPITLLFAAQVASTTFGDPKQHATATWLASDGAANPDGSIHTVIKMNVDEGWHTYWKNPGTAGLPVSIEAELPEGWSIGEIGYPVPKRFMTAELPGFGYEGEILYPVTLTAPEKFEGKLPVLNATVSWLTCDDSACVPGKAVLQLAVGPHQKLIETAYEALPRAIQDAKLTFLSAGESIQLTLTLAEGSEIDPSGFDIFPAIPDIIDPAATPIFSKNPTTPNAWLATAPKNEYLSDTPEKIVLVLKAKDGISYEVSSK